MSDLPDRDELSRMIKDAYYSARDNGGTMHTAGDDATDAILSSEWLAKVKAEASAEALEVAAENDLVKIPDALGYRVDAVFVESLVERADRIRREAGLTGA